MRRVQWIVLVITVLVTPSLFAKEKYSQCLDNCRPGVNECSNCCFAQQDVAAQPCRNACDVTQSKCIDTGTAKCKKDNPNHPEYCINYEARKCERTGWTCRRDCSVKDWDIAGACPGEIPPQKCPFNCQSWNSASKSCIGAPMNNDACKR